MLTVYDSQGKSFHLTERLGSGGEGTVFRVPHDPNTVAKIYHAAVTDEKTEKLRWMAAHQNAQLLKVAAWITDVLHDAPGGKTVGFLMPSVEAKEIHELYSLKSRRIHFPRATWQFLIHAATNVARAFYALHKSGHVMGDVNHGNCVVLANGTVKLIDCDSYSISDGARRYPCEVGVATHLAPELQGRNLAEIERLEVHDNFGLAVMIFQLLFLGRHPFAGNFAGGEDKSLEDCIRELRFAYARDAHLRQVKRPPGTLALDAVGASLAAMFERAFLGEDRPAAREWIEALEDLSSSLKPCSLHPGHHFFNQLAACPFCEIETGTGLMLFPFIGEQKDGEENFNIFTVENLIASFGVPPSLPVPVKNQIALPPSPEIEAERLNNWIRLLLFSFSEFVILIVTLYFFGIGGAFFIAILVATVMIGRLNLSVNHLYDSLSIDLENAQQDLKTLGAAWTSGGSAQFEKNLKQIRSKVADYKKIQHLSGQKMKSLRDHVFRYRLERYLSSFKIEDEKIYGVARNRLEKLKLAGVKSAADVEINHLRSLEAIGDATAARLLEWRQGLERNFHFDAAEIPEAEVKRFSTEFAERRRGIEREIEILLGTLRAGSLAVRQNQTQLQTKIETAAQRVRQAETDIKALGSGAAATITIIAVAFSTLLVGSIFEASTNLTRQTQYAGHEPVMVKRVSEKFSDTSGSRAVPASELHETVNPVNEKITDAEIAKMPAFERRAAAATLHRESLELVTKKNYKTAEEKLRVAMRFIRYDKAVLNELGHVLYRQEKYSESLTYLFESLNYVDPTNIGTKIYIGLNYLALKDFEKARDRFLEVTRQAAYSFDGNYNLGLAYKGLENYSAALESFRTAASLTPEDADVNYQIALCLDALGDAPGVREQYEILLIKDRILAGKLKKEIRLK